jgi:hypothetical protein
MNDNSGPGQPAYMARKDSREDERNPYRGPFQRDSEEEEELPQRDMVLKERRNRTDEVLGDGPVGVQRRFDAVDMERIANSYYDLSPLQLRKMREELETRLRDANNRLMRLEQLQALGREIQTHPTEWNDYQIGMTVLEIMVVNQPDGAARWNDLNQDIATFRKSIDRLPELTYNEALLDRLGIWPKPQKGGAKMSLEMILDKAVEEVVLRSRFQFASKLIPYIGLLVAFVEVGMAVEDAECDVLDGLESYSKRMELYVRWMDSVECWGREFRESLQSTAQRRTNEEIIKEEYEMQEPMVPPSVMDVGPNWPAGHPPVAEPDANPGEPTETFNLKWLDAFK